MITINCNGKTTQAQIVDEVRLYLNIPCSSYFSFPSVRVVPTAVLICQTVYSRILLRWAMAFCSSIGILPMILLSLRQKNLSQRPGRRPLPISTKRRRQQQQPLLLQVVLLRRRQARHPKLKPRVALRHIPLLHWLRQAKYPPQLPHILQFIIFPTLKHWSLVSVNWFFLRIAKIQHNLNLHSVFYPLCIFLSHREQWNIRFTISVAQGGFICLYLALSAALRSLSMKMLLDWYRLVFI